MRKNEILKNATFEVVKSCIPDYVECFISFKVNGEIQQDFLFINKRPNWTKDDYIKYAKKHYKPKTTKFKSFKLPFIATLSIFVISAVTLGSLWGLGIIGSGGGGGGDTPISAKYNAYFYDGNQEYENLRQTDISYGTRVYRPVNDPIKDGYDFTGWYTDSSLTSQYDFSQTLTGDDTEIKIYAKFDQKMCHVTYVPNKGAVDGDNLITVAYGDSIATPPVVKVDGVDTECTWYLDKNFDPATEFTFGADGTLVTEPILTLYGKVGGELSPDNFQTDSWDLFLSEIYNKSFDDIKNNSAYKDDAVDGTFVGLTRNIEIEDETGSTKTFTVLVVDENTTAEAGENKFTFMITDLDYSMKFAKDTTTNFYPDSDINLYLKSVLTGFPSVVKSHVQETTIKCYNPYPSTTGFEDFNTRIYIPSASQVFGESTSYKVEDSQFKYFEKSKDILKDGWLRTPRETTQGRTYFVDSDESLNFGSIMDSHKVIPVFIIK